MNRENKMWEAVMKEHGDLSRREAYVSLTAMEWADQTMLDKVCDWLLNHADNYVVVASCGCYYDNICLVNDLRQIMET